MGDVWIYLCLAGTVALAAVIYAAAVRVKSSKTIDRIEEMLTDAIRGEFVEKDYSEDRLSRLETTLYEYLNSSATSAVNVKNERDKIKTLIADISHQTKTPIANLLLHGELLEESELTAEQKESVSAILRESEKLRFLIDALVKLSRLENGILSLNPSRENVSALIRHVCEEMRAKAEGKGLELSAELPAGDESAPMAVFDNKWTAEALINIVDNAIKYTEKGYVRIKIREFEIFVCIDVSDSGIGIAEDEIPKIFSRFGRLEASRGAEGVGLGLYLAQKIISEEGGYIKVGSNPGAGSTFSVFLPK